MTTLIPVLLHTPVYSQVAGALTYLSDKPLPPGTLVRVPLGQRELLGVVWDAPDAENSLTDDAAPHWTPPNCALSQQRWMLCPH
jgi:primosomal protein N' (replication factor Y)